MFSLINLVRNRLRAIKIVTGKSLDSPKEGNVDKMSEKCPKNIQKLSGGAENTIFGHFFSFLPIWSMLLFGDPVQYRALGSPDRAIGCPYRPSVPLTGVLFLLSNYWALHLNGSNRDMFKPFRSLRRLIG